MKIPESACNLSVSEAFEALFASANLTLSTESLPVSKVLNLVTAMDVVAQHNYPKFDNSAMDGFVFLRADVARGRRTFTISGESRPEDSPPNELKSGETYRILTGAPLPEPSSDYQIVPIELLEESDHDVTIFRLPQGDSIRKQGEGYRKGDLVLPKNTVIRPYELGLLIESGNKSCEVYSPLRILIQVTGTEINDGNDTNGPVLEGLISSWPGVRVARLPVLTDNPSEVLHRLREVSTKADILVTTGGISAGKHDYILDAMQELGAEVIIRKVRQKPGKPFTVTKLQQATCFHLPGNPVSAVFSAEIYLRYYVRQLLHLPPTSQKAILGEDVQNSISDKTLFLTARTQIDQHQKVVVFPEKQMRSHLMNLYNNNNVYIRLGENELAKKGESVTIYPFS
jgi:molybdopterin molybdotransferase